MVKHHDVQGVRKSSFAELFMAVAKAHRADRDAISSEGMGPSLDRKTNLHSLARCRNKLCRNTSCRP